MFSHVNAEQGRFEFLYSLANIFRAFPLSNSFINVITNTSASISLYSMLKFEVIFKTKTIWKNSSICV